MSRYFIKFNKVADILNKNRNRKKGKNFPVRPSQLAGPASQPSPPPPSSSWRQSARRVAGARARPERHATSPSACLPRQRNAAALLLGAAPIPWPYPSLSPVLPPSLSLSHGRTPPSPPFAIAAVSDHPSLPRLAQELRLDSLFLPTAPQLPGSPASPPRRQIGRASCRERV